MKHSIWCYLLGHDWWITDRFEGDTRIDKTSDYCARCGLSKKEVGVKSE